MNLNQILDNVVSTQEDSSQRRLRAAVHLGARLALEAVLAESPYSTEANKLLRALNGEAEPQAPAVPQNGESL